MIEESTIELVPSDTIEALVIDQLEESSMEERLQELERAMDASKPRNEPCFCSKTMEEE